MSRQAATAAALLPEPIAPAPGAPRRLKPVTAPARRAKPKLAYALIALGGAAAIGIAQIGLSLAITQDSFVLADLTSQQRELDLQASALQDDLAGTSSPQLLATKASELGMVVAGSASYLRLSDSTVLGPNTGADGKSTIDPNGSGAVYNALLNQKADAAAAANDAEASANDTADAVDPNLPPPITDGLPSPTTR
ncbi:MULTISPECIES: hypothetical protein [Microbacterium]|uniref:Cell division protein FtsL n=1 Tax=Microbacterium profundi TaxID=450380 RepID=A0ABV3LEP9_9MICO|nr:MULTISPECIES: hypothetical protein [Microbacterium]MCE7483207.1 hypothetical protein [Microbacterium profundi]